MPFQNTHKEKEKLSLEIKKAETLHGHLGPFLVIGVRIGEVAKRILKVESNEKLRATAKIPLETPFSCILDGIQSTTQCTVGNQKLKIENSQREITVQFKLENPNSTLKIGVNQQIIEELKQKFSQGATNQELAWKIVELPENQLFSIEKQ